MRGCSIVHIVFAVAPLKIISAIVKLVFVFVVDLRKVERVRNKRHCNKSANPWSGMFTIHAKDCFSVAISVERNSQLFPVIMVYSAIAVDSSPVQASHSTKIADFVIALISDRRTPFFYSTTPSSPIICNGQKMPRPLVSAISSPVRIH